MFGDKVCIKQKATFFLLLLISILLLTLYFQNRTSNKNYLIQIEKAYEKSFDNFRMKFKSYMIQDYKTVSSFADDENFKEKLFLNEKYLKSVEIYELNQTSKYSKKLKNGESIIDTFIDEKKQVFYKVLIPIKNNRYVEYILDIRIFLKAIKDFDGSNGIVYYMDNDRSNDIFLHEYLESEIFKFMVEECSSHEEPVIEIQNEFYVKKSLDIKDINGELVANAIFFLDVTKEKRAFISMVRSSIFTSIVLFILAAFFVNYFTKTLIIKINKNEEELREINKNLEQTIEDEIKHRQKNEQLLLQHSKLAMLGEMIGNIAHQWRQPLMQISAILMYLDAYNEKGKLTPEKFDKKVKEGNSIIDFMSKTIEDFRNYYKPEKQKEKFFLKDSIESALFIVNSSLKASNIEVSLDYEDENVELESYKNEFSQALLNIITNAKDILISRKVRPAKINISSKKVDDNILIIVEDNAGGINKDVLSKIFDPYFTTKHKSQGTGIGLYMTKMIIENNMNGKIEVENSSLGAKFIISLKV